MFLPFVVPLLAKVGFTAVSTEAIEFYRKFLERTIKERRQQEKVIKYHFKLAFDIGGVWFWDFIKKLAGAKN